MAQVLTQEGGLLLWRQLLQLPPAAGSLVLHLLGASHAVVHSDTETILAGVELVVSGYNPLILSGGNWITSTIADGAQGVYPTVSWTFTAACVVYGYWLSDSTSTYSLLGETFANTFVYGAGGGVFSLNLTSYFVSQPFTLGPCY